MWRNQLTITEDYIKKNLVYVAEYTEALIVAYCSFVFLATPFKFSGIELRAGYWLEHMFVTPELIGMKIGTKFINHLKEICLQNQISEINVLSDPNAKIFYELMGFKYIRDIPSTI